MKRSINFRLDVFFLFELVAMRMNEEIYENFSKKDCSIGFCLQFNNKQNAIVTATMKVYEKYFLRLVEGKKENRCKTMEKEVHSYLICSCIV